MRGVELISIPVLNSDHRESPYCLIEQSPCLEKKLPLFHRGRMRSLHEVVSLSLPCSFNSRGMPFYNNDWKLGHIFWKFVIGIIIWLSYSDLCAFSLGRGDISCISNSWLAVWCECNMNRTLTPNLKTKEMQVNRKQEEQEFLFL